MASPDDFEREPSEESLYEEPTFNEVYFGHAYEEVDRDQILAFEIIRMAGDIEDDAEVHFGADVPDEAISNPQALKLEGPIGLDLARGCYQHDQEDHTIAYQAFHQYAERLRRRLSSEEYTNLERFVTWIEIVDSDQPQFASSREEAIEKNLPLRGVAPGAITPLWEGIKLVHRDDPQEMLEKAHEAFQLALKESYNPNLNEPLTDFPDFERYVDTQQEAKRAALEAYGRAKGGPQALVLKNGVSLALYDVRGIPAERGGLGVARRKAKIKIGEVPHFVILTAAGPREGTNKVLVSKSHDVPGEIEAFDVTAKLGERLNRSERFRGLGWARVEQAPAGGHRGVVGTSQEYGTALSSLEFALKVAFDRGLKAEEEMREAAASLATRLSEVSQQHFDYSVVWKQPENPDFLPLQVAILSTRGEDDTVKVTKIPEYEIGGEIGFVRENRRLMTAEERNQQRTQGALEHFRYYLETDLDLALSYLNEIPAGSLNLLSVEERLNLLTHLSRSEEAIDQVFNPYRMRWRISDEVLFDWERRDRKHGMTARFNRDSLAYKVDTVIIGDLYEGLSSSDNVNLQEKFVGSMVRILNANPVRKVHEAGEVYDNISYHLSLVAANVTYSSPHLNRIVGEKEARWDPAVVDLARDSLVTIMSDEEWRRFVVKYRGMLSVLAGKDPERFSKISEQYRYKDLGLVENVERRPPDIEGLKALEPGETATFYVNLGRPELRAIFRRQGVRVSAREISPPETLAGELVKPEWVLPHEERPLIRAIVSQVEDAMVAMPDDPSSKLRIVIAASPIHMAAMVSHLVSRRLGEDADRVIYTSYKLINRQTGEGEFRDSDPSAVFA